MSRGAIGPALALLAIGAPVANRERAEVARLIGRLNKRLGDRRELPTLLMGPGRWGTSTPSLGVPVTFAELSNITALAAATLPLLQQLFADNDTNIRQTDIVMLLTPPAFRPVMVRAAVEAGLHVYMAKPVAVDAWGCLEIEAAAAPAAGHHLAAADQHEIGEAAPFEQLGGADSAPLRKYHC